MDTQHAKEAAELLRQVNLLFIKTTETKAGESGVLGLLLLSPFRSNPRKVG